MEWDDFSIEMARTNIACTRRILKANFASLLVNAGLCGWNIYNLYSGFSHINWLTGIAIGCTGVTSLWVWFSMWEARIDLRSEKERIAILEKHRDERVRKGANEQHENVIDYYTKYVQEAQAKARAEERSKLAASFPTQPPLSD